MTQERDRLVINHMIYDQEHDTKLFTDVQKPRKGCFFSSGVFRVFSGGFFRAGFFNPNPALSAIGYLGNGENTDEN